MPIWHISLDCRDWYYTYRCELVAICDQLRVQELVFGCEDVTDCDFLLSGGRLVASGKHLISANQAQSLILELRGQRVILDRDLAALYEVETRVLNQAVKRNVDRFPADFVFQLTRDETAKLAAEHSRFANLRFARAGAFAFTEHGVIMAASVLNSPSAVEASVLVVRAFVKLRELLFTHKELAKKFTELESRLANHDVAIQQLLYAIRKLMDEPAAPPKSKIGFRG